MENTPLNIGDIPPHFIGKVLKGNYRIERKIGQGGMGAVYLATQISLGRSVAVKTVQANSSNEKGFMERFFREAKLLSALSHPNIISVLDFGTTDDNLGYIIMEYLVGDTLDKSVPVDKGLPMKNILEIIGQVCAGIGAAHDSHLIHRDLKPSNIFLHKLSGGGYQVKIFDFGIAKAMKDTDSQLTQEGAFLGTPGYVAPEQIGDSGDADTRSDIYSLGAILYFMFAGRRPFTGKASGILVQQLSENADFEQVERFNTPEGQILIPIILKAMQRKMGDRYQSAEELLNDLNNSYADILSVSSMSRSTGRLTPFNQVDLDSNPPNNTQKINKSANDVSVVIKKSHLSLFATIIIVILILGGGTLYVISQKNRSTPPTVSPTKSGSLQRGVTDDSILMGMSAAFSGPAKALGKEMKLGIETYFSEVNDAGGVNGRMLKLVALDDAYEPAKTTQQMQDLLENRQVFGLIGNVGTPTAEVAVPYAISQKALFFGAFTGATLLRKEPPDRYVFNYRASYTEETATIVKYLVESKKIDPKKIAVLAQEDGYGESGFQGVAKALRGYQIDKDAILRVGYKRNTIEVEPAVEKILQNRQKVEAIVMVATYKPATKFIQLLKDKNLNAVFTNVSFVGSQALAEELLNIGAKYGEGVIVTQVVPPYEASSDVAIRYREALKKYSPSEKPSFISFEGYICAKILAEALKKAGKDLTTERLISTIESIKDLDIGTGQPISFAPSEHQGSHKVWATVLDATGQYQPLDLP